jgi:hypothetical protein
MKGEKCLAQLKNSQLLKLSGESTYLAPVDGRLRAWANNSFSQSTTDGTTVSPPSRLSHALLTMLFSAANIKGCSTLLDPQPLYRNRFIYKPF